MTMTVTMMITITTSLKDRAPLTITLLAAPLWQKSWPPSLAARLQGGIIHPLEAIREKIGFNSDPSSNLFFGRY